MNPVRTDETPKVCLPGVPTSQHPVGEGILNLAAVWSWWFGLNGVPARGNEPVVAFGSVDPVPGEPAADPRARSMPSPVGV